MADLTFKGTTQQVLWEIANGSKIDKNTKVTINDNNYTLANLIAVIDADSGLNYKVVLEKTSAAFELSGDKTNILKMLAGVNNYTGPLTVTDGTAGYAISSADLNKIAAGTTGKVTATIDGSEAIDQTLVSALQDVKTSDNITFKPADDTLTNNAEISALISLSKILPKADFSAIDTIEGSANDVAVIKQALAILKNNAAVAVKINGSINAADINAISKATKGVLTADIRDGSIKATLSALKDVDASKDVITFATTDTTASAKDLVALAAKIGDANFDAKKVEIITADAKDADSVVNALGLTNIHATPEVKISGDVELTDIVDILTASNTASGKVTANLKAGTDTDLAAAITSGTGTDVLNLTITGATATTTNLLNLDNKTAGKIAVDATTISGNTAELVTLYTNAANTFTKLGNESVIFTNSPSLTQLNTVAAATSGKVTATLAATTPIDSDTVTALSAVKASDNISLTSSILTIAGDDLSALLAIKKIIPNANFASIASITAVDAKDIALVKNAIKLVKSDATVAFTIGEISAADANTISNATSGAVTATIKDGSVAATLKALKDVDVIAKADKFTFSATDKTAKASDLVALSDKIGATNFTAAKIETVTGTAADAASGDIAAALLLAGLITTNPEVKISGTVDSAYIKAIIDATNGKVTATLAADTAANLKTALTDSNATDENAINVTVTDDVAATTADNLNTIAKATTGKVKVDAKDLTGALADVNEVYFINKSKFTALGNENVTVTGPAASALDVDAIAKATSGVLTAGVTSDRANVLVSQLKNANAKDALTITVIDPLAGTTSAKDLIALTKKTSEVVIATGLLKGVSGSASEINSLLKAEKSIGVKYVTLDAAQPFTITGTAKAADVNDIALKTTGAVTATVAADTAAKLLSSLNNTNNLDMLTLTVNGATASVAELTALNFKTGVDIEVDAKEITGTGAELSTLYSTLPGAQPVGFANLGNENVKVTGTVAIADIANLNIILGATSGIVTASVAAGTASALAAGLTNAKATDALALKVNNEAGIALTSATDLLKLDGFTSVKVDAKGITNGITGTAAQLKQLVAAKGVEVAKDVNITVSELPAGTKTNASDLATILKSTLGTVTADVTADTAAALNKALTDKDVNALTLTVNSATATAKDLIELSGKTSVTGGVTVTAVTTITGNIAEVTKLFVTNKADFTGLAAQNVTISGTVTAAQADAIATATTGTVTATIAADTVSKLDAALTETGANAHALKLTTKGDDTTAADLNILDTKTTVAINANSIKNIDGNATDVKDIYTANKAGTISGLGNETVDLTGATDANVALVNAINGFTTGVITLPELTFGAIATTFALKNLGDLKGITGLVEINAENGVTDVKDIINISLKDLLEANDSKTDFTLNITTATGPTLDVVNLTNDVSGWTQAEITADTKYTYTNDKTGQVVTIEANAAVINA